MARNTIMAQRVEEAPVTYPLRFVVAGDSGAWPDPTAEAIFAGLVGQLEALDPAPVFFANLGDFAGPGTRERHDRYLGVVDALPFPNLCVVGNHDLDHRDGLQAWEAVHGPMNFDFGVGNTRFVVLHSEPGVVGEIDTPGIGSPEGCEGPRDDDLAFLDDALTAAPEPNRVVLMHMPPFLDGRYSPHEDWGFRQREAEFMTIAHRHGVKLVCCAHGLAFDHHVHEGIQFVMSGGGGSGLCSHLRGICTAGEGRPEDRGALFHAVEFTIAEDGDISGRVMQAFAEPNEFRFEF